MDRTTRSSTSDNGKIENHKKKIENGEMGSGEKGKRGNENLVCMDEFGKIESKLGTLV